MELILRNVRLAFCQDLFTPGVFNENDKPAYSSTFILPKDDEQNAKVKKVILEVAKTTWKDKAEQTLKSIKSKNNLCYRDGDDKAEYDGFENNMYIASRNPGDKKNAPIIINKDKSVLTEADGIPYAGCYVNVKLDLWAQDNKFGKRINAKILVVQFAKDGDAFGGTGVRADAADDMDDLSDTGEDDDIL